MCILGYTYPSSCLFFTAKTRASCGRRVADSDLMEAGLFFFFLIPALPEALCLSVTLSIQREVI